MTRTDRSEPSLLKRNPGIDALRLLSMLFVLLIHMMDAGGILERLSGAKLYEMGLLYMTVTCAVNCFAIISGYVGFDMAPKPFKLARPLLMWAQVFCYSFFIALAVYFLRPGLLSRGELVRFALPVSTEKYWYFSAYFPVLMLSPFLNHLIRTLPLKAIRALMLLLLLMFCLMDTLGSFVGIGAFGAWTISTGPFGLKDGYSCLWLMSLYLVGAWLKREKETERLKTWLLLSVFAVCALLLWGGVNLFPARRQSFMSYTNPLRLLMALSLVLLFSRIKAGPLATLRLKRWGSSAFAVYLIHCQPLVWGLLLVNRFAPLAELSGWLLPFAVIGLALVIMAGCLLIDKVRELIFRLILLRRLADFGERKLRKCLHLKREEGTEAN